MAVRSSQALHLPRFNFEDGRTGFSSACRASTFKMAVRGSQVLRPSRKQMEFVEQSYKQRAQLNPPRCGENTILVLRARRFSTLLNAPRCGGRSILAGRLTF